MTPEKIHITSIKDTRVIYARSLKSTMSRKQNGACLLYGIQALHWAIKAGWHIQSIFYTNESRNKVLSTVCESEFCLVSEGISKKISGTSYIIPILSVAAIPQQSNQKPQTADLVLMLDRIKDHGNIGTIIRTACAFGIQEIALCEMESDLFQRKTVEASRGTVFEVDAKNHRNSETAVKHFKKCGYQIVVTTPYGSALQSELKLNNQPVVLVIGNETDGVYPELIKLADSCIQMPMQPEVESLNVGVTAGISLYEIKIKVVFAMLTQKIKSTLGREINVASQLIMQQLDQELCSVSQFSGYEAIFLMQLSCDREITIDQIGRDTNLFGENLIKQIEHLHKNNFILPSSASENTWQITTTGEKWLAEIWPLVEKAEKKALKGFSKEDMHLLNEFIKRIQENCI